MNNAVVTICTNHKYKKEKRRLSPTPSRFTTNHNTIGKSLHYECTLSICIVSLFLLSEVVILKAIEQIFQMSGNGLCHCTCKYTKHFQKAKKTIVFLIHILWFCSLHPPIFVNNSVNTPKIFIADYQWIKKINSH